MGKTGRSQRRAGREAPWEPGGHEVEPDFVEGVLERVGDVFKKALDLEAMEIRYKVFDGWQVVGARYRRHAFLTRSHVKTHSLEKLPEGPSRYFVEIGEWYDGR